jgi:hypothetical protein
MGQLLKNVVLATGQIITGFHPTPPINNGEWRFLGSQAMAGDFIRVAHDLLKSRDKNHDAIERLQQEELDFGNAGKRTSRPA